MHRTLTSLCLVAVLGTIPTGTAGAASITLDFDSVPLSPGSCADASSYLNSFGVTFVAVSPGAMSIICNSVGTSVTPSSPNNVFFVQPAVTNTDESYDLLFSTPLTEISFTRATVDPATALPAWNAFAFDASDNLLDSVTQPLLFPGPPAASFTLTGMGITRLRIDAFNSAHVTFNHPPFDDLILVTPATSEVAEPGSLLLLGSGILAAGLRRRGRWKA